MRVTKDERGEFRVEDGVTRLEGKAAERFLEDVRAQEADRSDGARKEFMDECRRTYIETRERSGLGV